MDFAPVEMTCPCREVSRLGSCRAGIHPWNVNVLKENELQETIDFIETKSKVTAIGEIGLDNKYKQSAETDACFRQMLHLAEELISSNYPSREHRTK